MRTVGSAQHLICCNREISGPLHPKRPLDKRLKGYGVVGESFRLIELDKCHVGASGHVDEPAQQDRPVISTGVRHNARFWIVIPKGQNDGGAFANKLAFKQSKRRDLSSRVEFLVGVQEMLRGRHIVGTQMLGDFPFLKDEFNCHGPGHCLTIWRIVASSIRET